MKSVLADAHKEKKQDSAHAHTGFPYELTNRRLKMNGLELLAKIPPSTVKACFFDPQYRGVLDKLSYGNEGVKRGQKRSALAQMSEETIAQFITGINHVLM